MGIAIGRGGDHPSRAKGGEQVYSAETLVSTNNIHKARRIYPKEEFRLSENHRRKGWSTREDSLPCTCSTFWRATTIIHAMQNIDRHWPTCDMMSRAKRGEQQKHQDLVPLTPPSFPGPSSATHVTDSELGASITRRSRWRSEIRGFRSPPGAERKRAR